MKQNLRLGHVAGISVGAHWSTIVIVVLIGAVLASAVLPKAAPDHDPARYWMVAAAASLIFLLSLLAHELAHAIVARRCGVPVKSITLWLLGGITEFAGETKTPKDEFRVSVAGPLVSLVLGIFFYVTVLLLPGPVLLVAAVQWLALMNVVLAVFNMLPGAPLDGGRVLHAALWRRHGDRARADRAAAKAGQALGMMLIVAGGLELIFLGWTGGLWLMLIGWFLGSAARSEGLARVAHEGLKGWSVRDVMTASPDVAPAWQEIDDFVSTVASRSRQAVFPVVNFAGESAGTLSLEALTAIPPEQRHDRRISTVARPLPADRLLSPDDQATRILEVSGFSGELMAVVADAGRVVGMVTTADFTRSLQQAILRATSSRTGTATDQGSQRNHPTEPLHDPGA
ncbi:site-2 protease family protein [Sphaerisporangium flaviroseum]|uniref:Zinc metalloprotease n=1 Tax=Sphaerisporangium flaviroseum TaxID=509199 RepID=A0ABP7HI76_9ACTN